MQKMLNKMVVIDSVTILDWLGVIPCLAVCPWWQIWALLTLVNRERINKSDSTFLILLSFISQRPLGNRGYASADFSNNWNHWENSTGNKVKQLQDTQLYFKLLITYI